jgi:hypothetical protein
LGGVFEEARTNLLLFSANLTNVNYTPANATVTNTGSAGPDGSTTSGLITATLAGNRIQQAVNISASTAYTLSFWIKAGSASAGGLVANGVGGTPTTAGAIYTLSGNGSVFSTVGTGSPSATIKLHPSGWYRCTLTFTTGVGQTSVQIGPGVSDGSTYSSTIYPSAASGTINSTFGQLEAGSFATTYIPTAAASVTRAADVLTYPISGNIDQTVGSAFCRFFVAQQNPAIGQPLIANQLGAGNAQIYVPSGSSTHLSCFDGTSIVSSAAVADFRNTVTRVASTWGGATRAIYVNGAAKGTGAFDGDYNGTAIYIGCNAAAAQLNGCIRDIRIWQRVLSDSQIASIR